MNTLSVSDYSIGRSLLKRGIISDPETRDNLSLETLSYDLMSELFSRVSEDLETRQKDGQTVSLSDLQTLTRDLETQKKRLSDVRDNVSGDSPGSDPDNDPFVSLLDDLIIETERLTYSLVTISADIGSSESDSMLYILMTCPIVMDSLSLESPYLDYLETAGYRSERVREIVSEIDRMDSETDRLSRSEYDDLQTLSETADRVSQTLGSFWTDILMRHQRLTLRYYLTREIETHDRVSETLRERVSVSFLDSGGYPRYDPETGEYVGSSQGYGRHFEKNKTRQFDRDPDVNIDIGSWGITVSLSVHNWIVSRLEYDPLLDSLFFEYGSIPSLESESWLYCQNVFTEDIQTVSQYPGPSLSLGLSVSGLYGDSDPGITNTYNHESLLDQVLQFAYLEICGDPIVLLSVHNGADVRGGYTRPIMYRTRDRSDGSDVFRDSDIWIGSESGSLQLYSDDGYHLYSDSDPDDQVFSLYNWHTRADRERVRVRLERLTKRSEDLEHTISEFVTYGDPTDPRDDQTLSKLLNIRSRTLSDLQTLTEKYHETGRSLSWDKFRCLQTDDLIYMDSEDLRDHISDDRPIIFYRTNSETGEIELSSPGLGQIWIDPLY